MPTVKLEIQETKSTILVAKTQASLVIANQPVTLTVDESNVDLDAVQSAATIVLEKANVSLGITTSVNTITLGNSGPQGTPGVDGTDGTNGINGTDGPDGTDGAQGIPGERGEIGPIGPSGITSSKGIATIDFGSGNLTAETVVTGYPEITANSVVMASMRIVATAEHTTEDLLIDPIRLAVKDLVVGDGFTIYAEMDNAKANGTYQINWIIR